MDTKQTCEEKKVTCGCGKAFTSPVLFGNIVQRVCPECVEKQTKDREAEETRREEQAQREHVAAQIKKIPEKYRSLFTDKTDLLEKYYCKSVFITGAVGTGKTVFMASLAQRLINAGEKIRWINYSAFIMNLQSQYRVDSENPFKTAEEVARFSGWLFIDDLGAEKLTDYVRQITYYVLNEREQWNLPVCITSNYSLADIDELIDKRISSRISGICEAVRFTGADKRVVKK